MKIPSKTKVRREWRGNLINGHYTRPKAQRELASFMPRNSNELDRLANNDLARSTVTAQLEKALSTVKTTGQTQWDIIEAAASQLPCEALAESIAASEESSALFVKESQEFQQVPLDEMELRSNELNEFLPYSPSAYELFTTADKPTSLEQCYKDAELLDNERIRYARELPPSQLAKGRRKQLFKQPAID